MLRISLPPILRRSGLALLLVLLTAAARPALALQGLTGVHDPSTIIKQGNTYWTFATGDGIYSLYSTDLVNWQPGPRAVFPNKAWPGWINTKVPGFAGTFWAPECVFMNGKYYLYYSCSTFGSRTSAIGLAINTTLDPASPDYKWVDQGEVISTNGGFDNSTTEPNAIDPSVLRDTDGRVWMAYGSYFGGLRVLELDPITGKRLNTTQVAVGNNGAEAPYLTRRGSYYYLFLNRGTCCSGVNSTYYIQVGRATSPTGPFLDQDGVDLNQRGGTTVLASSGRYVGPGHAGLLDENGEIYFSHHYYDSYENGAPKLGLARLTWSAAGWPSVSRNWLPAGRYAIKSANNGLVWDAWGCTGEAGQAVAQGNNLNLTCQQWDLTPLGNGDYKITNALGGLAVSVANCAENAGAPLQLSAYKTEGCQQFHLDRAADGNYVWSVLNGNRVVEVPGASAVAGTQLGLWDYNGCNCQHWQLSATGLGTATAAARELRGVSVFPVPAGRSGFSVTLGELTAGAAVTVQVVDMQGRTVYARTLARPQPTLQVATPLASGLFRVLVRQGVRQAAQSVVVR